MPESVEMPAPVSTATRRPASTASSLGASTCRGEARYLRIFRPASAAEEWSGRPTSSWPPGGSAGRGRSAYRTRVAPRERRWCVPGAPPRLQDGQHVLDTGGVFCSCRDERGVHEPLVIDQRRNGGRGSRAVQEARDDDVSVVFPHAGN